MKNKKYYRFLGWYDGSGKPNGYIFKCYTKEEYEHYTKRCGQVLIEVREVIAYGR